MLNLMRDTSVSLRHDRLRRAVNSKPALFIRRRFKLCLISILIALSLGVVLVYSSLVTPAPKYSASAENFPLKLTIELDKREFKAGETIPVRMALKNIGNENISITYPTSGEATPEEDRPYRIIGLYLTVNDQLFWICAGGAMQATWTFTLEPSEQLTRTFLWDQKLLKTASQAPLGTYNLTAVIPPGGGYMGLNDVRIIGLRATLLAITIK